MSRIHSLANLATATSRFIWIPRWPFEVRDFPRLQQKKSMTTMMQSINPATEELIASYDPMTTQQVEEVLAGPRHAFVQSLRLESCAA